MAMLTHILDRASMDAFNPGLFLSPHWSDPLPAQLNLFKLGGGGGGGESSQVTFGVGEYFKCKFPLDKLWNLLPLMKGTSGES